MRARYTIQRIPYGEGGFDAHGRPIETWGPPEDQKVFGWAAPQSEEPKLAGHDRVAVDVEVGAPYGVTCKPMDQYVIEGKTYRVEGEPEDYNHSPFGGTPGIVINLRRVEG